MATLYWWASSNSSAAWSNAGSSGNWWTDRTELGASHSSSAAASAATSSDTVYMIGATTPSGPPSSALTLAKLDTGTTYWVTSSSSAAVDHAGLEASLAAAVTASKITIAASGTLIVGIPNDTSQTHSWAGNMNNLVASTIFQGTAVVHASAGVVTGTNPVIMRDSAAVAGGVIQGKAGTMPRSKWYDNATATAGTVHLPAQIMPGAATTWDTTGAALTLTTHASSSSGTQVQIYGGLTLKQHAIAALTVTSADFMFMSKTATLKMWGNFPVWSSASTAPMFKQGITGGAGVLGIG